MGVSDGVRHGTLERQAVLGTGNTGTEVAGSGRRVITGNNTEAFLVSPQARREENTDIQAPAGE